MSTARLRFTVTAFLLALLIPHRAAIAQIQPPVPPCPAIDPPAAAEEDDDPAAEWEGAVAWRRMTLADEYGYVSPYGLYSANLQRSASLGPSASSIGPKSVVTSTSWVSHGPQNGGGRTRAFLVNPLNPNQLLAGSASGGVWVSDNRGQSWRALTGYMSNLATVSLAFDASTPSTIYAGTGEYAYPDAILGAGVFKSTDGGQSWRQSAQTAGWTAVPALAAKPNTPGFVLAGTNVGLWRTTDGANSWQQVFAPPAGRQLIVLTIAFDPTGQYAVATTEDPDSGDRGVLYSVDGGNSFAASTTPASNASHGGAQVAFAPGPPSAVPTIFVWRVPDLLRSIDGGRTFQIFSTPGFPARGNGAFWISPTDANLMVIGEFDLHRSTDGGRTFQQISNWPVALDSNLPHVDQHVIVADANYATSHSIFVGNDGGVFLAPDITQPVVAWQTLNHGYQTTQFYSGAGHALGAAPIIGGTQDNGTILVTAATSPNGRMVWSGDGGFVAIDPTAPNIFYLATQNLGTFMRTTDGGASLSSIRSAALDSDAFLFVVPFILDPNNRSSLLLAGTQLWRTQNADTGNPPAWSSIRDGSPCLPGPNQPPQCRMYISAIAVAPGHPDTIWVGLADGRVDKTTNGTASRPSWSFVDDGVTKNPLPNRMVLRITIDPADPNVVYVCFGGYTHDNIYKTTDGGAHWQVITSGLPAVPVRALVRHPRNANQLYAATDAGVYESNDGGLTWVTSNAGPGDVAVDEVSFIIGSERLLAATHGRGLWSADTSSVPCLYRLSSTTASFPSVTPSTGSFNVIAEGTCPWTAAVEPAAASWLHVTSVTAASGNGVVNFSVDPNTTGFTRSGAIVVQGQRFVVVQSVGCSIHSLTPSGGFYSGQGGTASFDVVADAGCQWTAVVDTASKDWISIISPRDGAVMSGNGTVTFALASNTTPSNPADPKSASLPRYGKIVVNDKVFFANQAAVKPPECPLDANRQPTFSIRGPSTIRPDQNLSLVAFYPGAGFHYSWSMSPAPDGMSGIIGNDFPILFIRPGVGNPFYPRTDVPTTYRVTVTSAACPDGVTVSFTVTATGANAPCQLPLATSSNVVLQPSPGAPVTLGVGPEPSFFPWTPEKPSFQWYSGPSGDTSHPIDGATDDRVVVSPSFNSMYWVKMTTSCGGVQLSETALVVAGVPPPRRRAVSHGFSGTGTTDVLLRDASSGANALQPIDGAGDPLPRMPLPSFDPAYQAQTVADLNGDGRPDILWRNPETGENRYWPMNGSVVLSTLPLPSQDPSWNAGSAADYTGDGDQDVIWQNRNTGDLEMWVMDGMNHAGSYGIGRLPRGWMLAGTADFDRDSKPDLVFRNVLTGANAIWHMNDATPPNFTDTVAESARRPGVAAASVSSAVSATGDDGMPGVIESLPDTHWRIASVDDVDRDGQPDIVWINSATGEMMYWRMSFTSHVATVPLPPQTDPTFEVAGTPPVDVAPPPQAQPTAIQVSATPATYGGATTLTASLSANGAPLAGATVTFAIDGAPSGSAVTNDGGTASVTVSVAGLAAGAHTVAASFAGDAAYASSDAASMLQIAPQQVQLTWPSPAPIVYGTPLDGTQLDAAAPVPGSFVYSPAAGAILSAGEHTLQVTFTPADSGNYSAATATVTLTVRKATPLLQWTTPAAIVYGTPLSDTQLNATVSVPGPAPAGALTYTPAAGTVLRAGTATLTATSAETADYASATASVTIVVQKATPVVTWPAPAAITYGTALDGTQLDATSNVPGSFVYSPAAGTILPAGEHTLQVTFTPADATNYAPVTASVTLTVRKATPLLQWTAPAAIVYGTPLSDAQLNATVSVPGPAAAGALTYTPAAGTVLHAGTATLTVTSAETADYASATASVTLVVRKATPVITWPAPAAITYGTALGAPQLDATADVAGAFTYTPAAGSIPDAGSQVLHVAFVPANGNDYEDASAAVTLTVDRAQQQISWTPPSPVVYGTRLGAAQLNASVSVNGPAPAGALSYAPAAGTLLDAGTQTLTVTAAETPNYLPATQTVTLQVTKAPLAVTAASATKRYGAPLPELTGTISGVVAGDALTPLFSTTATAASPAGVYAITASVSDPNHRLRNYDVTLTPATLTVTPAPLLVTAVSFTTQYSDPFPPLAVTYDGFVLGETPAALGGALAFSTAATPRSAPGTYPLAIGGLTSANYAIAFAGGTITVLPEDARVTYTGMRMASTTGPNTGTATVTLSATVSDISATPAANGDASPGDIRNATLTFIDRATNATLCVAPLGLLRGDAATVAAGTCTWSAPLTASATLHVGVVVGGYYSRNDSGDDATLLVQLPGDHAVTGGGYSTVTSSGGELAADAATRVRQNVDARYAAGQPLLHGSVAIEWQHTTSDGVTHKYQISTPALTSLAANDAGTAAAVSAARATITDVTEPKAPVVVASDAVLLFTADRTDAGAPARSGVTVWKRAGGIWLEIASQEVDGGTIQIH